jgi:hypothetical protein
MPERQTSIGQRLLWWGVYLLGWGGTSALALWLILQIRINLIDLNNFLGWGPWILIAVDKFGLVVLGLGWLIGVFVVEIYLRAAPTLRHLLRRILRSLVLIGSALGVSYLLQWLLV